MGMNLVSTWNVFRLFIVCGIQPAWLHMMTRLTLMEVLSLLGNGFCWKLFNELRLGPMMGLIGLISLFCEVLPQPIFSLCSSIAKPERPEALY